MRKKMDEIEKTNILLVDDKSLNLLDLEALLRAPDRAIIRANSSNEALRLMFERDFAVVLLHVPMPEKGGFETAELMRSNAKTKRTPIIFVTAIRKAQTHLFKGYEAGAVDYLFKPIDPIILETKVGVFVDLHKQRKSLENTTRELEQAVMDLEKANMTIKEQKESIIEKERLEILLQMAGATAHELGQPLTVLLGNIELMTINKDNPEKLAQGMAKVKAAGNRISSIIRKIQNIRHAETQSYFESMITTDLENQ